VFRKNLTIISYEGQLLTQTELEDRYKDHTAPYAVIQKRGAYIDAALVRGAAAHANHQSSKPNARLACNTKGQVILVATVNITEGQEIHVNYNAGRGPRYRVDERNVTHKTSRSRLQHIIHKPPVILYSSAEKGAMFKQVHGKKNGHWGTAKTWRELNMHYPGHGIPYKKIETLVAECPDCQKHRITRSTLVIAPSAAVLQPPDEYNTVSCDGFKLQPDDSGYCWINICRNLGTSFISLFPSKSKDASAAADALLQLRATAGQFRYLQTDPGSDYTSRIVAEMNKFLGVHHHIGTTNNPRATGIERDVQEAKRFIAELSRNHLLAKHWSSPRVLAVAQFLINDDPDVTTGLSPNMLTFGKQDADLRKALRVPSTDAAAPTSRETHHTMLTQDLRELNSVWTAHKATRALELTEGNLIAPQNLYQTGDFILKSLAKLGRDNFFSARRLGPYEVTSQTTNMVHCTSLVDGNARHFPVDECQLFAGTREDAIRLARQDNHQWEVTEIIGWRGDPLQRSSLSFLARYETSEEIWMSYDTDISTTTAFTVYCAVRAPLHGLNSTAKDARTVATQRNKTPIALTLEQVVYLDVRFLSHLSYQLISFDLPGKYSTRFVVATTVASVSRTRVTLSIPVLQTRLSLNQSALDAWVMLSLDTTYPDPLVTVTHELLLRHPSIKQAHMPHSLTPSQQAALLDPYT